MKPQTKKNITGKKNLLEMPIRLQWENGHGFCGQTAIQACSIYYGNYMSQFFIRKIAQGQVLVGQNAEEAIQKLGYDIDVWDNSQPKPQYKAYLQWIKQHIQKQNPVIICGYHNGQNDEYDHIYLAVGVKSNDMGKYSDDDELIYMDFFDNDYTVTKFGQIFDTKEMKGNGQNLEFAIPKNVNYGIAILGIKDPESQFYPVRLYLDQREEPNVSTGQEPKQFNYRVAVSGLEEGKKYVLLRYENNKFTPSSGVKGNEKPSQRLQFTAEGESWETTGSVMSDKSVFYRCVEDNN